MYYQTVLIASSAYHGDEPLTYGTTEKFKIGSIVQVPMRSGKVLGIVVGNVTKPKFTAKNILGKLVDEVLPATTRRMIEWFGNYYPATSGVIVSQFIPSNLLLKEGNVTVKIEQTKLHQPKPPTLTKDQTEALQIIKTSKKRTFLIHGDTATGKTRVYIELAKEALVQNKSVLILTPEISLTSQLAQTVEQQISNPVIIIHSNLTLKERREIWLQSLYSKKPLVIIGPRSALFLPLRDIGLIIVDEAHDGAYKQDQSPRYHALRVAGKLAEVHSSRLIFGTATPLVSEYFYLKAKGIPIIRLTEVAAGAIKPPKMSIVNAREKEQYSRNTYLSNALLDELSKALNAGEQSLVFLNRRGTARIVMCQNCDWHAVCPRCSIPLTYHGDSHSMRCHTCGYVTKAVTSCPACNSLDIVFKSIGTKAISSALEKLFPQAVIRRFDTDNQKNERFEQHYEAVKKGEVDIIVGTQLLVKGLDLPKLSMVGVVAADSSLYFPDYTSEELTYQLLTQVIGRVSRGHRLGNVVIQTYNPEGRALTAALTKDWDGFYHEQIIERQEHLFPPFCYILKLFCSKTTQKSAMAACIKLVTQLQSLHLGIEISEPTPRFIELVRGKYNWQILVKSKQRSALVSVMQQLPSGWNHDIDPLNLL